MCSCILRDITAAFCCFHNQTFVYAHSNMYYYSASLPINAIECKRYWNRTFAYPTCRSVCQSVCPESVQWQNG